MACIRALLLCTALQAVWGLRTGGVGRADTGHDQGLPLEGPQAHRGAGTASNEAAGRALQTTNDVTITYYSGPDCGATLDPVPDNNRRSVVIVPNGQCNRVPTSPADAMGLGSGYAVVCHPTGATDATGTSAAVGTGASAATSTGTATGTIRFCSDTSCDRPCESVVHFRSGQCLSNDATRFGASSYVVTCPGTGNAGGGTPTSPGAPEASTTAGAGPSTTATTTTSGPQTHTQPLELPPQHLTLTIPAVLLGSGPSGGASGPTGGEESGGTVTVVIPLPSDTDTMATPVATLPLQAVLELLGLAGTATSTAGQSGDAVTTAVQLATGLAQTTVLDVMTVEQVIAALPGLTEATVAWLRASIHPGETVVLLVNANGTDSSPVGLAVSSEPGSSDPQQQMGAGSTLTILITVPPGVSVTLPAGVSVPQGIMIVGGPGASSTEPHNAGGNSSQSSSGGGSTANLLLPERPGGMPAEGSAGSPDGSGSGAGATQAGGGRTAGFLPELPGGQPVGSGEQ